MRDPEETLPAFQRPHKPLRRRFWFWAALLLGVLLVISVVVPSSPRRQVIEQVNDLVSSRLTEVIATRLDYHEPASLDTTKARFAYATLLTHDLDQDDEKLEDDNYFIGVRILIYQTLYAPETKSPGNYPFIVLVNKAVSQAKRDRLRRDGAIVWEPEEVDPGWISTGSLREDYQSVLLKLRIWELTQFERICFLDSDMIINRSLDGIFLDPAVQVQTTGTNASEIRDDEAVLPAEYVFGGVAELRHDHHWPPAPETDDWYDIDYMNAGFFVTKPSPAVLEYYLSLLQTPDRFDAGFPEQNLWNYAHRMGGNMPWQRLALDWNSHFPAYEDLEGGVASLHTHWWKPYKTKLVPYLLSWRWKMEGFFQERDNIYDKLGI